MASLLARNRQSLLVLASLSIVVLISFWRVSDCDFTNFDDDIYVTANAWVRQGITPDGIRWAFTTNENANWFPLTWLSHMLDVELFGLDPRWHHLSNLLFHVANTLLLFLVLQRMTRALWQSAFVAALFGVHPLHVESVAWVAERKDVLSTFFWMLTLAAYCSYVEKPKLQRYLLVVLSFAVGLMAKPMLVTLPFVLLLLDHWPLQRSWKPTDGKPGAAVDERGAREGRPESRLVLARGAIGPLLREKLPLFYLALLSSFVTYRVQHAGGAMVSFEARPLDLRISNALVSYLVYLRKTVWPNDLAILYPYPSSFPTWQVLGSALLLAVVTAAVLRKASRAPYLTTGWLWYVGTLVPVIGLVHVGRQPLADRYTYIPSIGLFIIVAWGVSELSRSWRHRRQALVAAATLVLATLCIATMQQTRHWQNSIALFEHALEVTEDNYVAHYNRGAAHAKLGNHVEAIRDFDAVIAINSDLEQAIGINAEYVMAYDFRGCSYAALGDHGRAISSFDAAVALDPRYAKAYYNRGNSFLQLGKYAAAIDDFSKTIENDPSLADAYNNRAYAHMQLGHRTRALEDLRAAARLGSRLAQDALRNEGMGW